MIRQQLIIVGAGGHGKELAAYVADIVRSGWNGAWLGYLDDALSMQRAAKVVGCLDVFANCADGFLRNLHYVTAIGDNGTRRDIVARLTSLYNDRLRPWTLEHPYSYVGADVEIGLGTCLAPGAMVTSSSRVGRHCILNVKASVSHDCSVGDFVNVNPGATICGNVTVGDGAYIGAGATIKERVSIGAWSVIGAGATVVTDIPPNVTAVGVPARVIRESLVPR